MSNAPQKSAGAPYPVLLIVGLALMVGGMWFSQNIHIVAIDSLTKQGLPIDLGETAATIGVLIILFPLIKMFFIVPLQEAIQDRNSHLEKTFAEVETLRTDMEKMRTDYEARLVETEANAREQIKEQIREAQALRQTLMSEATERADALLEQAQQQIEQEKAKALLEIRSSVVDLTLAATEKLIGENLDDARNRRLVEEFINSVEVAR
jgi:F-type H+-transporting ATPase subunit b